MTKPKLSDPVSLRIPAELLNDLEKVAEATERKRSWLMVRAFKLYMATEGRDILAAVEGRRQIADGQSHDMDTVLREMEAIAGGKAA